MRALLIAASAMLLVASTASAQDKNYPKAKVSFDDFKGLVAEVEVHRAERLVDLETFLRMSKEPGVVILDTRSTFRFNRIHVKGAKHLNFSDFTQDNLRGVIPTFETTVLIYCNNNFEGNQTDFTSKVAMPVARPRVTPATQFAAQAKPLMMALNIPTYVNLYGYGYRNVFELNELVDPTFRMLCPCILDFRHSDFKASCFSMLLVFDHLRFDRSLHVFHLVMRPSTRILLLLPPSSPS